MSSSEFAGFAEVHRNVHHSFQATSIYSFLSSSLLDLYPLEGIINHPRMIWCAGQETALSAHFSP
jgi:hypothetical protein